METTSSDWESLDVTANRSFTRLAAGFAQSSGTVYQDGIYTYIRKSVSITGRFLVFESRCIIVKRGVLI